MFASTEFGRLLLFAVEELGQCVYEGVTRDSGSTWAISDCVNCHCDDGSISCEFFGCQCPGKQTLFARRLVGREPETFVGLVFAQSLQGCDCSSFSRNFAFVSVDCYKGYPGKNRNKSHPCLCVFLQN